MYTLVLSRCRDISQTDSSLFHHYTKIKRREDLPITPLSQHPRQTLQKPLINLIKPPSRRAINVNQPNRLTTHQNWHHNLTPALHITGNMARELQHIIHKHRLTPLRRRPADPAPKVDELAGGLSLEGAQEEDVRCFLGAGVFSGLWLGGEFVIADVEACPVYGGGVDGVGVPQEGGNVCEIAF